MPVRGDYLPGAAGPLALVSWHPPEGVPPRFVALHLPAFGEEMNKSRRMVALQARAFEAMGGASYVLDPRGTGDSDGEFGEATWEGWSSDALTAWTWIRGRYPGHVPRVLWGLRLGALLAWDLATTAAIVPSALLLWQPVISGKAFFDQFLRIARVQDVAGSGESRSRDSLRAQLANGTPVEVAGYDLNPGLIAGAEAVEVGRLPAPPCPVIWRELSADDAPASSPAAIKIVSGWQAAGSRVDLAAVRGPPFWMSLEIEEAPALVKSTSEALASMDSSLAAGA